MLFEEGSQLVHLGLAEVGFGDAFLELWHGSPGEDSMGIEFGLLELG